MYHDKQGPKFGLTTAESNKWTWWPSTLLDLSTKPLGLEYCRAWPQDSPSNACKSPFPLPNGAKRESKDEEKMPFQTQWIWTYSPLLNFFLISITDFTPITGVIPGCAQGPPLAELRHPVQFSSIQLGVEAVSATCKTGPLPSILFFLALCLFHFKRKAYPREAKVSLCGAECPLPLGTWNYIHCSYLLANQLVKCLFHDLLDTKSVYISHGKILDIIFL